LIPAPMGWCCRHNPGILFLGSTPMSCGDGGIGDKLMIVAMPPFPQCQRRRDGGATAAATTAVMTRLWFSQHNTPSELVSSLPPLLL
jgi:hypothetical protein